jgi:5-methylcytosine-specific restriction endonuclease McrA
MNRLEIKSELKRLEKMIFDTKNFELVNLYKSLEKPHSTKVYKAHKKQYEEYLSSTKWRTKRKEVFAARGEKCEKCTSTTSLQIHHLTYENVFNEKLEDLQILCRSCHKKEHRI